MSSRILICLCAGTLAGGSFTPQSATDRGQPSLLIVDTNGDGIRLTSLANGVLLNVGGGESVRMAWTVAGSDDSFVAYDQTRNGRIDSLLEILGGIFALGPPDGFEFLRQNADGYATEAQLQKQDRSSHQPDGVVDERDAMFHRLILWTDVNHNGVSEELELQSLTFAGFQSIDLKVTRRPEKDSNGNVIAARSRATRRMPDGSAKRVEILAVKLAR